MDVSEEDKVTLYSAEKQVGSAATIQHRLGLADSVPKHLPPNLGALLYPLAGNLQEIQAEGAYTENQSVTEGLLQEKKCRHR